MFPVMRPSAVTTRKTILFSRILRSKLIFLTVLHAGRSFDEVPSFPVGHPIPCLDERVIGVCTTSILSGKLRDFTGGGQCSVGFDKITLRGVISLNRHRSRRGPFTVVRLSSMGKTQKLRVLSIRIPLVFFYYTSLVVSFPPARSSTYARLHVARTYAHTLPMILERN